MSLNDPLPFGLVAEGQTRVVNFFYLGFKIALSLRFLSSTLSFNGHR